MKNLFIDGKKIDSIISNSKFEGVLKLGGKYESVFLLNLDSNYFKNYVKQYSSLEKNLEKRSEVFFTHSEHFNIPARLSYEAIE
jgi:hypothetical protein